MFTHLIGFRTGTTEMGVTDLILDSYHGRALAAKTLEFRTAVTRADEGNVPRLSVMIRLTEPDPHLLTKSKERSRQESNRDQKKSTSSVFVLQMEERAQKSYN